MQYAEPIQRLIKALTRLPGIGERSATRMALYILNSRNGYIDELTGALTDVRDRVTLCSVCCSFSDVDPCGICDDPARDPSVVCVVSDYKDMMALESMGGYRGVYHILHGNLSPLKGIGPEDLRIHELVERVDGSRGGSHGVSHGGGGGITEVILATGFDPEGEATSAYLAGIIRPLGPRVTRLASGVPVGSFVEYMDGATLGRALEGRREFSG